MSLLYFGLDMFCQFEARVPELDAGFSIQYAMYTVQSTGGGGRFACQIMEL